MNMPRDIDVLVVDHSASQRERLTDILAADPHLHVVGAVADGEAALAFLDQCRPDIVLIHGATADPEGYATARLIMERRPLPIVLCNTAARSGRDADARAADAGVVARLPQPPVSAHPDFARSADELRRTVRLMSEVRVVRRHARVEQKSQSSIRLPRPAPIAVVGIGGSTGAPQVLQIILKKIAGDFPVPVLAVQHMAEGFLVGMVNWLGRSTQLPIHIAEADQTALAGHVYLAPDGFHMGLSASGQIRLSLDAAEHGLRPSVSYLFRSLAESYGRAAVGVLLTGMGRDGAAELRLMREKGAVTIAQDRASSIVHGMPGEAIALGGASNILAADQIAHALMALAAPRVAR
jgi:two-component system chemotaxis response regulator CheB